MNYDEGLIGSNYMDELLMVALNEILKQQKYIIESLDGLKKTR